VVLDKQQDFGKIKPFTSEEVKAYLERVRKIHAKVISIPTPLSVVIAHPTWWSSSSKKTNMNEELKRQLSSFVANLPVATKSMMRPRWDNWYVGRPDVSESYLSNRGKHPVHVTVNYKCEGTYGDKQRVVYLGLHITVWNSKSSIRASSATVRPGASGEYIFRVIRRLACQADKLCIHANNRETRLLGNCWHEYECLDCGAIYQIDSSG